MAPFQGYGPLLGDKLLLTTKSPGIIGIYFDNDGTSSFGHWGPELKNDTLRI